MDLTRTWEHLRSYLDELPHEFQIAVTQRSHEQLFNLVARGLLSSAFTDLLLVACEDILPEACARLTDLGSYLEVLSTYARILPFAPYLSESAYSYLCHSNHRRTSTDALAGRESEYLLALLRLLQFDHDHFSDLVDVNIISTTSSHPDSVVRLLSAQVAALYLGAAETSSRRLQTEWQSTGTDLGLWEGKQIHYGLLPLWEAHRERQMIQALKQNRGFERVPTDVRSDFSIIGTNVASLAGVMLPGKPQAVHTQSGPNFIFTLTTSRNLERLGSALRTASPLLVSGKAGSGKSTAIQHAAFSLGKLDGLITLHINEQSDAKTLIGIYTTGSTPGSFVWQAGVLTKAVTEGRWVLIEDLDRAPPEVISVLLPLIERQELIIPGRSQVIKAALGFRLLATIRTTEDLKGQEIDISHRILGIRQWETVHFDHPSAEELPQLISGLFPDIEPLIPTLINAFLNLRRLQTETKRNGISRTVTVRPLNSRELLDWAARISSLAGGKKTITHDEEDQIFLSAVDCFAGFLPDGENKEEYIASIAQDCGIDPQRRDHLITSRAIPHRVDGDAVTIGVYRIPRHSIASGTKSSTSRFSLNNHTSRQLERVAAAVCNREPVLLVGETGTGKTTSIQYLANSIGKRLVPFNLSQQSESGDMLGGFKPVSTSTIIIPVQDEFDHLFQATFSSRVIVKNQAFLDLLNKCIAKKQWSRVCKCWHKAIGMVRDLGQSSPTVDTATSTNGPSQKKRRIESNVSEDIVSRWDRFQAKVKDIEVRLQSNSDATIAFSFVEGGIVRAAREGDWVLLDEINLASPDTLEALADLFSKSPSIMLSEAGSASVIQAHPDFRVFAAMNPATDVGKKDLPSGIRSRFTELYIESPDRDLQSLQHIVQTYLGPTESFLSEVASRLHQAILRMCDEGKLVDGAGQRPHFSLRTLTRVLLFARDIASQCSLRRALHEGFCMSYLTLLDVESEKRVLPIITSHFYGSAPKAHAELLQPMKQPLSEHGSTFVREGKYWVKTGNIPIEEQPNYIITEYVQSNLDKLIRAAMTRRFPILIQGPTSSGKTSMVEYLAKKSGHKFVRINNHEHTDLQEYLGSYVSGRDGKLVFQEGLLVRALREGHWIVLDELNLAPTDVLEALNRLLDDNRELLIPETQETVRPHPNFMLFATQNPAGIYGGRKALSRAFRNRFLELHFDDIPISELHIILERRARIPPKWSQLIVNVYKELSVLRQKGNVFEQKGFATLRDLFRWALRPAETKQELAEQGFMLLGERCRGSDERQEVKTVIERVMSSPGPRVSLAEDELYARLANIEPVGGIVLTRAMKRLYALTVSAIENNEPVLLVGETGCGKTTVCQVIALVRSQRLNIVNAHQNTETGDLIGAQRPARNRSAVEGKLIELIRGYPSAEVQQALATDGLSGALKTLNKPDPGTGDHADLLNSIIALRDQLNVLFEWKDGSLVEAMKTGSLFLLDEISLADDSVLERLNSVLEPHRTILLAEKGSVDSFVTASPEFQFFATMNPGGDYGKKELSPALRNRFTEIWVPALSAEEDVLDVLSARLTLKEFARPMYQFASWFHSNYSNVPAGSVHIRDLLAWAEFMNQKRDGLDDFSWLFHGAGMVYIDRIGADPAGMVGVDTAQIQAQRRACVSRLLNIMASDTTSISLEELAADVGGTSVTSRGFLTSSVGGELEAAAPTVVANAVKVARAMCLPKPILLEGPPGVGKTTLVTKLAEVARVPLTRINLSEQTDLMDLFGSDVPTEGAGLANFAWRDAPFLRAMRKGEWVLLDEMNLASQSILEGLNACLDHRGEIYIPELNQTFYKHPSFRLFAAQNPHHQGGGRKGLPSSFVNRFTVVYADTLTTTDVLEILKLNGNIIDPAWQKLIPILDYIDELTKLINTGQVGNAGAPWELNLRDISRWAHLKRSDITQLAHGSFKHFLETIIVGRFRTLEDQLKAKQLFETFSKERSSEEFDMVYSKDQSLLQVGKAILPRNEIMSSRLKRNYEYYDLRPNLHVLESLMICIKENWPVLLVGTAGIGKSAMIQKLAETTGTKVSTFALNAEIDSMDLVGGYEQRDPLRSLQDAAHGLRELGRHLLLSSSTSCHFDPLGMKLWYSSKQWLLSESLPSRSELRSLCDEIARHSFTGAEELVARLEQNLQQILSQSETDDQCHFEWINGTLIQAMERGDWLVLDNANLCSPAALDRLNSLLEPNGQLLVNENPDADGEARVITRHPNFRIILTMDPRHGELSRALRNRCVELAFLQGQEKRAERSSSESVFHHDSVHHRFSTVGFLDSHVSPGKDQRKVAAVASLMSFKDAESWPALLGDIRSGLFNTSEQADDLGLYIRGLDRRARQDPFTPAPYLGLQTLNPGNNVALLWGSGVEDHDRIRDAMLLRSIADAAAHQVTMQNALSQVRASVAPGKSMSRLHKSVLQSDDQSIFRVLEEILQTIDAILDTDDIDANNFPIFLVNWRLEWWDLFDYFSNMEAPEMVLQILWWRFVNEWQRHMAFLERPLTNRWSQVAFPTIFSTDVTCIDALWIALRPSSSATEDIFLTRKELYRLSRRFDDLLWRMALPLEEKLRLRTSIVNVLTTSATQRGASDEISQIVGAVIRQAEVGDISDTSIEPFLQSEMESLVQVLDLWRASNIVWNDEKAQYVINVAYTLAGRSSSSICQTFPTKAGHGTHPHTRLVFRLMGSYRGSNNVMMATDSSRRNLGGTILQKLHSVQDVIIERVDLLVEEMKVMGNLLATNTSAFDTDPLAQLQHIFKDLVTDILEIMIGGLGHSGSRFAKQLKRQAHSPEKLQLDQLLPPLDQNSAESRLNGLGISIMRKYFEPSALHVGQNILERTPSATSKLEFAEAWLSFFVGCVLLYTPRMSYDPAVHATLINELSSRRCAALEDDLRALEEIEMYRSGHLSHFRIRHAQAVLERYQWAAESIETPPVWRPKRSSSDALQSVLKALAHSMEIFNGQDTDMVLITAAKDPLLRRSIAQVQSRLNSDFEEFADFTEPLHGFLVCLQIGFDLVDSISGEGAATKPMPFCLPMATTEENIKDLANVTALAAPRVLAITSLKVFESMRPQSLKGEPRQHQIERLLQGCYSLWKDKLESEQERSATMSSMYRYRGDAELETEMDEEEFDTLFPSGEKESSDRNSAPEAIDVQKHAAQVATAVEDYYNRPGSLKDNILDLLERFSSDSKELTCDAKLLPATMWRFDSRLQSLQVSQSTEAGNYNIYSDPNLGQIKTMVDLIAKVESRFTTLRKAWPEHATLEDVLRTCKELRAFAHTDPLTKILTKVEKLHEQIHEWQTVASKEFSAATQYDAVTDLIISWRRLELSTWSRLLDQEVVKCEQDAKSWFFLAYESLVSTLDEHAAIQGADHSHAVELVRTLESFIRSTGLGQFSSRLRILSDLLRFISSRGAGGASSHVVSALANFIAYMQRFEAPVREAIQKGRASLDKDMRNVIQLASWKDRNILTLKQSAKKSHRALFKTIRKFRSLLGQPVEPIIAAGFVSNVSMTVSTMDLRHDTSLTVLLQEAAVASSVACERQLQGWREAPARFRNTSATVALIEKLSAISETTISPTEELNVWISDVLNEAAILKKATPSELTTESKASAQHLKARKRKLFAQVLRDLRVMGFKSNLSTDVLARQDSTAKVFASNNDVRDTSTLQKAEQCLQEVLHFMPQVRNASREHSADLTGAEVGRSVALLESMLCQSLEQRSGLVSHLQASQAFDAHLSTLRDLSILNDVRPSSHTELRNFGNLHDGVVSTFGTLGAAAEIMKSQFRLANEDGSRQIDQIRAMSESLAHLVKRFEDLPSLPQGLICREMTELASDSIGALDTVRQELDDMIDDSPALEPLIDQVRIWLPALEVDDSVTDAMDTDNTFEAQRDVFNFVDQMLGAVQNLPDVFATLPRSIEEVLWYTKANSVLETALSKVSTMAVASQLSGIFDRLHLLDQNQCHSTLSMLLALSPILLQYQSTTGDLLNRSISDYTALISVSAKLTKAFVNLAKDGFCSPQEKGGSNDEQDSKVEAGTGLGDGEGAEDISKDIGDDEDLTELAEEKNQQEQGEDLEDEKDAVDMADADLEGEMGEGETKEEGDGDEKEEDEQDIDEEAGSVDDLGENTVDEKMWDDGGNMDSEKEQTADKADGTKDKDEMAAATEDKKKQPEPSDKENADADAEAEEELVGAEEEENAPVPEAERADPTMQDQENLDLPDDINMDGEEIADDLDDDMNMSDDQGEDADINEDTAMQNEGEEQDDQNATEPDELEQELEIEMDEDLAEETKEAGETADEEHVAEEEPENVLQDNRPDNSIAADQTVPDAGGTGLDQDDHQNEMDADTQAGNAERSQGADAEKKEMQQASGNQGETGDVEEEVAQAEEPDAAEQAREAFRKLGDALDKWYKKQRDIEEGKTKDDQAQDQSDNKADKEVNLDDAEFEHLKDEDEEADTQALGAAREDEATALNDTATGVNEEDRRDQFADDDRSVDVQQEDIEMANTDKNEAAREEQQSEEPGSKAFVGERNSDDNKDGPDRPQTPMSVESDDEESVSQLDNRLQVASLSAPRAAPLDRSEAQSIWQSHEAKTSALSLQLQEQLRLILNPTQSSKLRGDFRTGKRLNIKRIIPYIASNYKRDKIWLRRSVPSKRQYQIMLAVDDSRSMAEAGVDNLAFRTLALVTKALTMLEAGDISVLGFGKDVVTPVAFGDPLGPDAGTRIVQQLRFDQTSTDVKGLLQRAHGMFEEAAARRSGPQGMVWQLMLVLGDGVFEDAEGVRRAERAMRDMGVMVVFVIVDAFGRSAESDDAAPRQSIMDLQVATFSKGEDGATVLNTRKYLETFPFRYYLIVRDVAELPGVLAGALRQWFAEVAESG